MAGKLRKVVVLSVVLQAVIICGTAQAAPEFRLSMSSLNLQQGVSATMTLSLINAQGADILEVEGLEHFDVVSRSQSTSISIVNASTSHQVDVIYTIIPKDTGQFTLKAKVRYGGTIYESNALQVTVSEVPASDEKAEGDLFIRTVLSKDEIYLGEKVVLTYELYSRYSIESAGFVDYTAIDGVVAKETPRDQLRSEYVYFDGVRYAKYVIKQLIIDPIKAGTVAIPSFNVQVNVISDAFGGAFGGFFSSSRAMYLRTQARELTVKPLPAEGKPKDFSGIVGTLQLEGSYTKEEVEIGDSLSLLVTASGNVNLDGLKKVFSGSVPGFAVYETQKNSAEFVRDGQYYAQKDFEVIMVPQRPGTVEVAPVTISYFNPETEQYERAEIPGQVIEILGEMPVAVVSGGGSQAAGPAAVETVTVAQVSYLAPDEDALTIRINRETMFWVLIGIGGALSVVLVL
ncbi:MAG TPA: BatD family protein, partial [Limnochordia bacterium]|nr:BatD family protein [Limnochordia bacterium]